MNRIILIGNGFDLAHGLKTGYKDFIDDFWRREAEKIKKRAKREGNGVYGGVYYRFDLQVKEDYLREHGFVGADVEYKDVGDPASIFPNEVNSFADFNEAIKKYSQRYKPSPYLFFEIKNKFLEYISHKTALQKWVDIEEEYHDFLNKTAKGEGKLYDKKEYQYKSVANLNISFGNVRLSLERYLKRQVKQKQKTIEGLSEIISSDVDINDLTSLGEVKVMESECAKIEEEIRNIQGFTHFGLAEQQGFINKYNKLYKQTLRVKDIFDVTKEERLPILMRFAKSIINKPTYKLTPNNTLFLNFNYTDLEEPYLGEDDKIIHIHGELNNPQNPIIFGYGDELCDEYKELERMNDNTLLENIKSIKYMDTSNYRNLLSFIDSEEYQIFVMGHSCGNSDRTLLNTLFEHKNCVSIKVFFYEWEEETKKTKKNKLKNDYSDIVRNISRNFNDKRALREKVVNKEDCEKMPQAPKA